MKCDECPNEAVVTVSAAWPVTEHEVGKYPAPMMRDCGEHLMDRIKKDQEGSPGATPGYFLRVVV